MTTATTDQTVSTREPRTEGVVHLSPPDSDGIAVLRLGAPSEKVVTFTERRLHSLRDALQGLREHGGLRGLVVTGPAPDMFAAGADISLIEAISDRAEGEAAARLGQSIFAMFELLRVPVVAAIEGPCLGGGLELALSCDVRVASDTPTTSIGLPEVKLGIAPGFGGTQRLPRLVGLPKALDLILQGKMLRPAAARRAGVVDRVVPPQRLLRAAREEVVHLAQHGAKRPRRRLRGAAYWLSRCAPLRGMVQRRVQKTLARGPARFYPAPPRALELCIRAFTESGDAGFQAEARALGELIATPTCKALVRLFFLTERAKRLGKADGSRAVHSAFVLGAGAMGAGIAGLLAGKGIRARLCDLSSAALAAAKGRLQKSLDKRVRRRSLGRHEARAAQDGLAVASEWGRLERTELFLEAVVEDLEVKRKLFTQAIGRGLPEDAVLASNTSSLPIDAMAEGLPNPARVIGMHFFNPPEKMPLVEVIVGPRTSAETVATTCRLAVKLGKFPVVVKDSPGFLVNRCLAPYLNEAARILLEGCDPSELDRAMLEFGLPMGPARLMDEVGFDVALKVSEVMSAAFPERMQPCPLFAAMVEAGHLGAKSGGGILAAGGRAVLRRLRQGTPHQPDREELIARLIYPMVDEAYRCLEDGLVESEDDLDLGLVMGMGFPPFTGGISRYARSVGLGAIVERLRDLAVRHGRRFAPGAGLTGRVEKAP